jgi:hypothetical protein
MRRLIYLFFCLVFTACSSKENVNIITSACTPPCWKGIVSGETTKEEARDNLINATKEDSIIIEKWPFEIYEERLIWINEIDQRVDVLLFDELVQVIYLSNLGNMTLSDVFEEFGEPTSIFAYPISSITTEPFIVNLIYPDQGIIMTLFKPSKNQINLQHDDLIYDISFVASDHFNYYLDEQIREFSSYAVKNNYLPWQGYGIYDYVLK